MKYLMILLVLLSLAACQSKTGEEQQPLQAETVLPAEKAVTTPQEQPQEGGTTEQPPPTPPLYEDFQATPQLSLFPRAGAFRPEDDDDQGLQFWRTFIDHLTRTSGPLKTGDEADPNIAFGFRAIKGLDSVGVFSPIAVAPATTYEVSARLSCELAEDASAGIGLLEFDEFLWIGEQFSESMVKEHQRGTQQGLKLSGKVENQKHSFRFTSGPDTRMIHLVFFRDGAPDRNPVVIDDIGIKAVEK